MRGLVAVAVASVSVPALADVVNGSFELQAQASAGRYDINLLSDWTAQGGFMLLERGVNGVSNIAAHTGDQFVSMGHNGSQGDQLFQVFATETGRTYDVSFWIHCIQGSGNEAMLSRVHDAATGDVLGSAQGAVSSPTQGWVQFSYTFEASSNSSKIVFTHTSGTTSANIALDTVIVVPGPGSLALLGLGASLRRRR